MYARRSGVISSELLSLVVVFRSSKQLLSAPLHPSFGTRRHIHGSRTLVVAGQLTLFPCWSSIYSLLHVDIGQETLQLTMRMFSSFHRE